MSTNVSKVEVFYNINIEIPTPVGVETSASTVTSTASNAIAVERKSIAEKTYSLADLKQRITLSQPLARYWGYFLDGMVVGLLIGMIIFGIALTGVLNALSFGAALAIVFGCPFAGAALGAVVGKIIGNYKIAKYKDKESLNNLGGPLKYSEAELKVHLKGLQIFERKNIRLKKDYIRCNHGGGDINYKKVPENVVMETLFDLGLSRTAKLIAGY